jgi:hypothetical protein
VEIAPEVLNRAAPDTGNIETLHLFAAPQQREQWLLPRLAESPMRPKESSSYSWHLAASLI